MHALHKCLLFCLLAGLGQNALGSEIIRGKRVPDGLMLYMASVQNSKHIHMCGGFLISEDFVVTAAHCDKNEPRSVVLGTHNLKKVDKKMRYDVKRCKHPSYVNVGGGDDIMLLKLSRKAPLKNGVQLIQLPRTNDNIKGKKCCVAGWGFTKTGGTVVDVLQVVNVPIVKLQECKKQWKAIKNGFDLPANVTCAGGYGTNKGFCQGDSGGPLVCGGKAVGIVSFNMKANCDYPNVPNVYTDVSKYLHWIKEILKKKDC